MKSILGGGEGSADSRGKEKDTMGIIEISDGPCGRMTLFVRLQKEIKKWLWLPESRGRRMSLCRRLYLNTTEYLTLG